MKRVVWWFLGLVVVIGIEFSHNATAASSLNNFVIVDYDMRLELGRDNEQRSTLQISETITADFIHQDRNRGIERAIPQSYEGHSTSLQVISVTDDKGVPVEYTIYDDNNDNRIIRIGSKDTYVFGKKTYVLTYLQRDITLSTASGLDEFYWDLNGTDWKVPIRQFGAEITIAPELVGAYRQSACYQGGYSSQMSCQIALEDKRHFAVGPVSLAAGENMTVALGFEKGTFALYQPSLMERLVGVWLVALLAGGVIVLIVTVVSALRWSNVVNRKKEIGSIAPEYTPPKDASVTLAAEVIDLPRSLLAAQLLDFAVRHYIKIYEVKEKKLFTPAEYELEIIKSVQTLRAEERELLSDLFDGKLAVGQRLEMKQLRNDVKLYQRTQDNPAKLKHLVRGEYALRGKIAEQSRWFTRRAKLLLLLGVFTLSPIGLIGAAIVWFMGHTLWPLTDKGLALRRYLEGLKLYIGLAEKERLKILQSPEGVEKIGYVVDGESPSKLLKLYEKALPYAVLFGQEKEWGKRLGDYYGQIGESPDWYSGTYAGAFNATALTAAVSSFSTATAYTSASSSSTGGSGGGGSSGGGGGGGGGGGW